MFLSRFWCNAEEEQEFRSLEVRGKLIALKKKNCEKKLYIRNSDLGLDLTGAYFSRSDYKDQPIFCWI